MRHEIFSLQAFKFFFKRFIMESVRKQQDILGQNNRFLVFAVYFFLNLGDSPGIWETRHQVIFIPITVFNNGSFSVFVSLDYNKVFLFSGKSLEYINKPCKKEKSYFVWTDTEANASIYKLFYFAVEKYVLKPLSKRNRKRSPLNFCSMHADLIRNLHLTFQIT